MTLQAPLLAGEASKTYHHVHLKKFFWSISPIKAAPKGTDRNLGPRRDLWVLGSVIKKVA